MTQTPDKIRENKYENKDNSKHMWQTYRDENRIGLTSGRWQKNLGQTAGESDRTATDLPKTSSLASTFPSSSRCCPLKNFVATSRVSASRIMYLWRDDRRKRK